HCTAVFPYTTALPILFSQVRALLLISRSLSSSSLTPSLKIFPSRMVFGGVSVRTTRRSYASSRLSKFWNVLLSVSFSDSSTAFRSEEHTSELQSRFDL